MYQIVICYERLIVISSSNTFRLLSCVLGEVSKDQAKNHAPQHPLELSDIMPLAKKTYDKMRPPKYQGKVCI